MSDIKDKLAHFKKELFGDKDFKEEGKKMLQNLKLINSTDNSAKSPKEDVMTKGKNTPVQKESKGNLEALEKEGKKGRIWALARTFGIGLRRTGQVVGGGAAAYKGIEGMGKMGAKDTTTMSKKEKVAHYGKGAGFATLFVGGASIGMLGMLDIIEDVALRADEKWEQLKENRAQRKAEKEAKKTKKVTKKAS